MTWKHRESFDSGRSNEAVKMNAHARKEELRRFSDRYTECVISPEEYRLRSDRMISEALNMHYQDSFPAI